MNTFEDKVFFVTGGANGIGAALARTLLSENARHVAFADIARREGMALESELNNKFGALRAKFIKCDVTNEDELSEALRQVTDKYRRLDVVVNNAGLLATEDEAYRRVIEVNFMATVNVTLKALDMMRADKGGVGGTVVNVSSLLALHQSPCLPVFAAAKSAVMHFSNTIGMDPLYSRTKVRVLTVCFGPTDTAILHRDTFDQTHSDDKCLIVSTSQRQSVESAVLGVLDVIRRGEGGSTWVVAEDKPAVDITLKIKEAYETLSRGMCTENLL